MSCWAIAKCTIWNRCLSCFCGIWKDAVNCSFTLTVGNSSAPSVCSAKRLLPAAMVAFLLATEIATSAVSGRARRMSISFLAETVVAPLSLPGPSDAVVWIWISTSVARKDTRSPSLRSRTLARIGSVCRRSTMPATVCRGLRIASLLALMNCMS